MSIALILTAAGRSERMESPVKKEYLPLEQNNPDGITVLSSALFAFIDTGLFDTAVITVPPGGEKEAREVLSRDSRLRSSLLSTPTESGPTTRIFFAEGGASRQASVLNGLELLARVTETGAPDIVLIHDGARPWIDSATIHAVITAVTMHGAAVPAVPPVDTQKEIDCEGKIIRHLVRSHIAAVQTPQGFRFAPLLNAHRKAATDNQEYTDDTEIWARYSGDVWTCPGNIANRKITYKGDL